MIGVRTHARHKADNPAPAFAGNSSRVHLHAFIARAAASVPAGGLVLDAGAGPCWHAPQFAHACYEAADMRQVEGAYRPVDYVCDLSALPVEDDRFALILMTQVLEHVPEPGAVLSELYRVLEPGRALWLSAPLFYQEHEQPYDFFRYTQFGLRHLLDRAGFVVEELDWLEGYFGTLAYELRMAMGALPSTSAQFGGGLRGALWAQAARLARPCGQALAHGLADLDVRHRLTDRGMPKNYVVVARKPG